MVEGKKPSQKWISAFLPFNHRWEKSSGAEMTLILVVNYPGNVFCSEPLAEKHINRNSQWYGTGQKYTKV